MKAGGVGATEERIALASEVARLRDESHVDMTWLEIAAQLGISRSYASALYTDPDGAKARARKDSYAGACVDCGGPTSGSDGRAAAPERCAQCSLPEKKWTREVVLDAIQRFAAVHGRPPLSQEWLHSDPVNDYPPRSAVYGKRNGNSIPAFPKWADAIEAAGFPRPTVGRKVTRPARPRNPEGDTRMASQQRRYVILEQDDEQRWIQHESVAAYTEALAIETFVASQSEMNGRASHRFVAIPENRWSVRQLQAVTTHKAVVVA